MNGYERRNKKVLRCWQKTESGGWCVGNCLSSMKEVVIWTAYIFLVECSFCFGSISVLSPLSDEFSYKQYLSLMFGSCSFVCQLFQTVLYAYVYLMTFSFAVWYIFTTVCYKYYYNYNYNIVMERFIKTMSTSHPFEDWEAECVIWLPYNEKVNW